MALISVSTTDDNHDEKLQEMTSIYNELNVIYDTLWNKYGVYLGEGLHIDSDPGNFIDISLVSSPDPLAYLDMVKVYLNHLETLNSE
jgi:hypothetical protein